MHSCVKHFSIFHLQMLQTKILEELVWVPECFDMKLNPKSGGFYKFIGYDEGEIRCLFYHVIRVDLSLCNIGDSGVRNRSLLSDDTWERKVLYDCDALDYV